MSRAGYINEYMNEKYDRINLTVPKGEKAKIKETADGLNMSVNEYLYTLVREDLSGGTSKLAKKKSGFTDDDVKMLDRWQIAAKYREMIESMYVEEISGTNKRYTIILKSAYTNDITGDRYIRTDKMQEIRRIIKKSHKK